MKSQFNGFSFFMIILLGWLTYEILRVMKEIEEMFLTDEKSKNKGGKEK